MVEFYLDERDRQTEARYNADKQFTIASTDTMRSEWGKDYRENVNRIGAFLDLAPKGVKELVNGGRGPDGKPFGSNPQILRWLIDMARAVNPAGVTVPGGGDLGKSVEGEIADIEKMMREDRKAYNDPKISGPEGEYQRLLAAREGMTKKAA